MCSVVEVSEREKFESVLLEALYEVKALVLTASESSNKVWKFPQHSGRSSQAAGFDVVETSGNASQRNTMYTSSTCCLPTRGNLQL